MSETVAESKTDKELGHPENPDTDSTSDQKVVPLSALVSERKKRQEMEAELNKFRDESKKKELKKLEEDGKLKELAEKYKGDLDSLAAEYNSLKENFDAKNKEFEDYVSKAKEAILKNIPDNLKKVASKMGLAELQELYEGLGKEKIITDKTIHPGNNGKVKPKNLAEWKQQFMK